MLPIVQRELQVAARNPKLYAWRIRAGLLVFLVATGLILSSSVRVSAGTAGGVFQVLSFLALLICLLEGTRRCADSISEEKRQGTLGLLFLTDLKGFDIVLGKFTAACVRSFSVLFAFVPILAVTLLIGGTTGAEFWRMVLVLFATLFASLSFCLLISTLTSTGSIGASLGILGLWTIVPFLMRAVPGVPALGWISTLSPLSLFADSSEAYYSRNPSFLWFGLGGIFILAISSLGLASLILPSVWQDKPTGRKTSPQSEITRSRESKSKNGVLLDRNPVAWLFFSARASRQIQLAHWIGGSLACFGMFAINFVRPSYGTNIPTGTEAILPGIIILILVILTSLFVANESSRNLAEAKSNGALEMILSTPVTVPQIISGQWLALRPALIAAVTILTGAAILGSVYAIAVQAHFGIFLLLKSITQSILGFLAAGWAGMWMALTSKTPARAFFKTILVGLILPHLICTPTILNQIALIVIANERVKARFRQYVADRYLQQEGFMLSPVPPSEVSTPPVLR